MTKYRTHLAVLAALLLLGQGVTMANSRSTDGQGERVTSIEAAPPVISAPRSADPPATARPAGPLVDRGKAVAVEPARAPEPPSTTVETVPATTTTTTTVPAPPEPEPTTPPGPEQAPAATTVAPPPPAPPTTVAHHPHTPTAKPSTTGGIPVGAEAPVAANYRAADFLRTNLPIPASTAHEPTGNFRFVCEVSHLAYDDPIIAPGQAGASHLHMFFGNTAADANSTYQSLRSSGGSTCQGGPLNRSAYWTPAVFDGSGKVVMPEVISVYYKGRGWGTDGSRVDVVDIPAGLRMIAGAIPGDPNSSSAHQWYCETTQNKQKSIPSCPKGERLGVVMAFPTCWNGTELDSPDHRSHVRYPVRDAMSGQLACPGSHPKSLPEFTLGVWFPPNTDSSSWYLSSDRMPGAAHHDDGASFHADWFGAWDLDIQSTWTSRCINGMLDCSFGDLGDSRGLAGPVDYTGPARVAPPAP